ncbi:MAG: leucyl aminopeptidase [Kordia sp.]|nr:MAG: leucyl aminopeptidase [Kordia sp.]
MKLIKKITYTLLFLSITHFSIAQTHNAYYQGIVDNCTLLSVTTNLNEFVNHGVKSVGSSEIDNAKNWLKAKYLSYGYTDIVEDTFTTGGSSTTNIVVTKVGLVYPNTYVIIDGHYDTINGVGANDNGSGTTLILEIAKQLANVPTEYSIKFINFSAEEIGLKGSQHYVNNVVNATNPKLDIRLVLNIDQIGGRSDMINDTIVCERDTDNQNGNDVASNLITDELIVCIGLYSSLSTEKSYAYSSDYIPFENNGEIITGLYEKNETLHSHSSTDVIANMDVNYLYEITKGATGAVLHFAVANQALSVEENILEEVKFFPNPAQYFINISSGNLGLKNSNIKLINLTGKIAYSKEVLNDVKDCRIPLVNVKSGVYLLELIINDNKKIEKIIVE